MSDPRAEVPQTVQALPSIGAVLIWLSGKPVEWWAAVLGMFFIAIQIGYVLWRWRRDVRRERERIAASRQPDEDDDE